MDSNSVSVIEFLMVISKLKHLKRTGWVRKGVKDPECVASHMYRMSVMGMLVPNSSNLDKNKIIKMALVHDMAEAVVGDITPLCGVAEADKYTMEKNALLEMTKLISNISIADEIISLWQEYEDNATEEAKLVKDFDKFDMILQAYEYEKDQPHIGDHGLNEFFTTTEGIFKTDMVKNWNDALRKLRNTNSSEPSS